MSTFTSSSLKPLAKKLRREFETIMVDPYTPNRFQWDWWHLPGRYTHLRTPATQFFSDQLLADVEAELRRYGREHLGCQDISPLWLSCYVEGCEQRLHADRPHGPWAFVLSLTPEKRGFQGGETILLRPEILNLWNQGVPAGRAFEENEILERIPSQSGRLLVFDPRIPHGVSRVSGTVNPLEGRLVIHGWFTQPRPFVEGPLSPKAAEHALSAFDQRLASAIEKEFSGQVLSTGTAAFRIDILASGKTKTVTALASSMTSGDVQIQSKERRALQKIVKDHFSHWTFPKMKLKSSLTLSLSFER